MWHNHVNRMKDMIISTDAEKAFDKISTFFHIKNSQQTGYSTPWRSYLTSPYLVSYSVVKSWKLFLWDQEQHKDALIPLISSTVAEVLVRAIRKGIQIGKEEVKLSPFVDDMMMFTETSKDSTKKKNFLKQLNGDFPGGLVDKNLPANAGDTVWPLVREDSTHLRATKPVGHNYWAHALEPVVHSRSDPTEEPLHCKEEE